jgi:hypothetical protein
VKIFLGILSCILSRWPRQLILRPLSILLYFLLCSSLLVLDSTYSSIPSNTMQHNTTTHCNITLQQNTGNHYFAYLFQVWPPKSGRYLLTVLLMMGILVPETCWGNKTAHFVASSWFFTFTVPTMHGHVDITTMHGHMDIKIG